MQDELRGSDARDDRDTAEHERFREQLRDDPAAAGAECAPHDDLVLARHRSREHQQRDIAAHQEQQHHQEQVDREEHPRLFGGHPGDPRGIGHDLRAQVFVSIPEGVRAALPVNRELRLGLFERYVSRETAEDPDRRPFTTPVVESIEPKRDPCFVKNGEAEALRHDADDRALDRSHPNGAPDDHRVAPETRLPDLVPDDHDIGSSRPFVSLGAAPGPSAAEHE